MIPTFRRARLARFLSTCSQQLDHFPSRLATPTIISHYRITSTSIPDSSVLPVPLTIASCLLSLICVILWILIFFVLDLLYTMCQIAILQDKPALFTIQNALVQKVCNIVEMKDRIPNDANILITYFNPFYFVFRF